MANQMPPTQRVGSYGRIGRALSEQHVDCYGQTDAERDYDDMLMAELSEDMERERIEGHWPASDEDQLIIAANTSWPNFDPSDGDTGIYRTFREAA